MRSSSVTGHMVAPICPEYAALTLTKSKMAIHGSGLVRLVIGLHLRSLGEPEEPATFGR